MYGKDGEQLNLDQLLSQLRQVVNESKEKGFPVGLLTAEKRQEVYEGYNILAQGTCIYICKCE